jgi:hypothetical protein
MGQTTVSLLGHADHLGRENPFGGSADQTRSRSDSHETPCSTSGLRGGCAVDWDLRRQELVKTGFYTDPYNGCWMDSWKDLQEGFHYP